MFNNALILCAAAGGAAAILTILIRIYIDYIRTPSPSEVLDMIEGVDKGIMTVNEARKTAGFEPINEFQKVAHDFGETKTPPTAENKRGKIRTARICQNCGSNMFESTKSIFSITCAYCGTTYDTNKSIFDD